MNNKQLANLRRLADAATPGPWSSYYSISDAEWVYFDGDNLAGRIVFSVLDDGNPTQAKADAEYIAAACNTVPELLDSLAAMTARAEAAEQAALVKGNEWAQAIQHATVFRERAERAEARELGLLAANAGVARVGADWLDELTAMTQRAEQAEAKLAAAPETAAALAAMTARAEQAERDYHAMEERWGHMMDELDAAIIRAEQAEAKLEPWRVTVGALHCMYELYEQTHEDSGIGQGRMTYVDWVRYMTTDENGDTYPVDGIVWPQQEAQP